MSNLKKLSGITVIVLLMLLAACVHAFASGGNGGSSGANFGTTTTTTNPQVNGDNSTGFYTSGAAKIDAAIAGTKTLEIGTSSLSVIGTENISGTSLSIGTTTPSTGINLDIGSLTGGVLMPVGTTGQRPASPKNGEMRYNSTTNKFEGYINAAWNEFAGYGSYAINVMAWPYNATCNGTTNDTTAIHNALLVGLPVFFPPTTGGCAASAAAVPSDSILLGSSSPQYTSNPGAAWSHIVPASGASYMLDYNGNGGILIQNLDILGDPTASNYQSTLTCINAGNTYDDEFLFASVRFCGNGGLGDLGDYPNTVVSIDTNWIANGQTNASAAIMNPVDSQIDGGYFTSNYDGIYFGSGANNNTIAPHTRIEFNTDAGVNCNGAAKETIAGSFDRNANAAIAFAGCGASLGASGNGSGVDQTGFANGIAVSGLFTRNGTTNTAGNEAHFEFYGGNHNIVFSNITTSHDCGDNGCSSDGPNSPKYVFEFADATDAGIMIGAGQYTGFTTAPINYRSGQPADIQVIGAMGISPSRLNYETDFYGNIVINTLATPGTPVITHAGTAGAATWTYKVVASVGSGELTAASAAGSTTTGNATLTTSNYNIITIQPVAGAYQYLVYRTAHGTTPSTNGLIATVPAQQLVVLDKALAGDSATASVTNTTGAVMIGTSQPIQNSINVAGGFYVNGVLVTGGGGGSGTVTSITPGAGVASSNVGGTSAITTAGTLYADGSYFPNFLGGLTLSNDGGTPNTILDVAAGAAVDSTNAVMMKIAAFTGTTGGTWVVGSGNAKLDTGTIAASTWYHVFIIERTDTGVVDILFSLSPTAPTMPTNYSYKRRIGSFKTNGSSNIIAFTQVGNTFYWTTQVLDLNTSSLSTSAVLETLGSIPTGVKVVPLCRYSVSNASANSVILTSGDETDVAPTSTNPFSAAPGFDMLDSSLTVGVQNTGCPFLTTNTSGQIRARATAASTTLAIVTRGWID